MASGLLRSAEWRRADGRHVQRRCVRSARPRCHDRGSGRACVRRHSRGGQHRQVRRKPGLPAAAAQPATRRESVRRDRRGCPARARLAQRCPPGPAVRHSGSDHGRPVPAGVERPRDPRGGLHKLHRWAAAVTRAVRVDRSGGARAGRQPAEPDPGRRPGPGAARRQPAEPATANTPSGASHRRDRPPGDRRAARTSSRAARCARPGRGRQSGRTAGGRRRPGSPEHSPRSAAQPDRRASDGSGQRRGQARGHATVQEHERPGAGPGSERPASWTSGRAAPGQRHRQGPRRQHHPALGQPR